MTCHDLLGLQISKHFLLKKGRAVLNREHIVACSIVFGKAEAVQEYTRKENK